MFTAAFHTGRRCILFTAMACLCVLLGGPSCAAGATHCEPGASGPGWAWTDADGAVVARVVIEPQGATAPAGETNVREVPGDGAGGPAAPNADPATGEPMGQPATNPAVKLLRDFVSLFVDPNTNPKGAQLIYSTHDVTLMTRMSPMEKVLERDQVWFVEKDSEGASQLIAAMEYSPRANENLGRNYLNGVYVPLPNPSFKQLVSQLMKKGADING